MKTTSEGKNSHSLPSLSLSLEWICFSNESAFKGAGHGIETEKFREREREREGEREKLRERNSEKEREKLRERNGNEGLKNKQSRRNDCINNGPLEKVTCCYLPAFW